MTALDARSILRRFLVLRAMRWFPTGLLIPVVVLFLVDRGLSLGQIGVAFAAQGLVVLLLELPTGGLADAIGRRRVLLLANLFELGALSMLAFGRSLAWFAVVFAIEGVYRALESGPLDAWFVDAGHGVAEDFDVEGGLSRAGVVLGLAIASGAILSGLLVSWDPIPGVDALAAPIIAAIVLRTADTVMIAWLMIEVRSPLGLSAISQTVRRVPTIIGDALHLTRTSTALALLVGVELFWGFGMATFETLFPARLGVVLGSTSEAGALMGPISAAAWVAFAGGAALVTWFSRRVGRHVAAASMRLLQGSTVVAMGILGGVVGLVAAYLGCLLVHGASNPVHQALLHEQAQAKNRATVMSLNSMVGHTAGAVGGIVLGAVADGAGIPVGMYVGAMVLAAAAPLYLIAGRQTLRSTLVATPLDR